MDEGTDVNSANRLSIICLEIPNVKFQAQEILAKEKTPETVAEMMNLIKKAGSIDSRLENWARTLPDVWDVETRKIVTVEPENMATAEVWPGPIHIYRDLMIANVLNDHRICRIFCQSVVLGCIAALPPDSQSDHLRRVSTQSIYVIQRMVNEFSWSIPYLMGFDYYSRPGARPQDEKCKHPFP